MFTSSKTVDGVTGGFTKVVNDLQRVAEHQVALAAQKRQIAVDADAIADAAEAEAAKAQAVAAKVSAILEG